MAAADREPDEPTGRIRIVEERLAGLTEQLCGLRDVAERMVRLQQAWDEHGPSLAQWKLFAVPLGELLTLLQRDAFPAFKPASGQRIQRPVFDLAGIKGYTTSRFSFALTYSPLVAPGRQRRLAARKRHALQRRPR